MVEIGERGSTIAPRRSADPIARANEAGEGITRTIGDASDVEQLARLRLDQPAFPLGLSCDRRRLARWDVADAFDETWCIREAQPFPTTS